MRTLGYLIFFSILAAVIGCDAPKPPADPHAVIVTGGTGIEGARFTVRSEGKFNAGFENNAREILVLTDNETGEQYLAVTDCSLVQLISKQRRERAAEAARDAAESIAEAFSED